MDNFPNYQQAIVLRKEMTEETTTDKLGLSFFGSKTLFGENLVQKYSRIVNDKDAQPDDRIQASNWLADYYFKKAKSEINLYEQRNYLIQAGVYLEFNLFLVASYKEGKHQSLDEKWLFESAILLKQIDINGSYWQIKFDNNSLPLQLYPNIKALIDRYPISLLLSCRNDAVLVSILNEYLTGKLKLDKDDYMMLAVKYPLITRDILWGQLSSHPKTDLTKFHLNDLPEIKESTLNKLVFSSRSIKVSSDKERLYEHLGSMKINQESIDKIISDKIEEEYFWLNWATHNKNKLYNNEDVTLLNKFIQKHNQNPLSLFAIDQNVLKDLTLEQFDKIRKQTFLKYHPDKRHGENEETQAINNAKFLAVKEVAEVLSTKERFNLAKKMFLNNSLNAQEDTGLSHVNALTAIQFIKDLKQINKVSSNPKEEGLTYVMRFVNTCNKPSLLTNILVYLRAHHDEFANIRNKSWHSFLFTGNFEDTNCIKVACSEEWYKILMAIQHSIQSLEKDAQVYTLTNK